MMKEQLKFHTSQSEAQTINVDPGQFAKDHLELRVGELETVIFQQREQILSLKDECIVLKRQMEESQGGNKDQMALLEMRNKNLMELNRKHEQGLSACTSDVMKTYNSITSPENRSTQVETERMRQCLQ